jgi:uncharacterized LabA/DUF88 family protein
MSNRTFVYVDGFNLYYRALKARPYKWLDLHALAAKILSPNEIVEVKYYTARVSGKRDPGEPGRQNAYLRALKTIPGLSIHYGRFLPKKIWRPMVNPPPTGSEYIEVYSAEEKGSDVNLASHLIRDGFQRKYEVAVVVSKDTDLTEPIRIVAKELGLPVGLICPDGEVPDDLKKAASFVRHIVNHDLAASQFPNPIFGRNGKPIHKPPHW